MSDTWHLCARKRHITLTQPKLIAGSYCFIPPWMSKSCHRYIGWGECYLKNQNLHCIWGCTINYFSKTEQSSNCIDEKHGRFHCPNSIDKFIRLWIILGQMQQLHWTANVSQLQVNHTFSNVLFSHEVKVVSLAPSSRTGSACEGEESCRARKSLQRFLMTTKVIW